MNILQDIILILASSLVIIIVCTRIKIPTVVGFLITGIIIGPHGLKLTRSVYEIEIIAEIGVAMMLFIIGIEFSLKKIRRKKKLMLFGGGGQIFLTIIAVLLFALLKNISAEEGIFLGMLVALSSTAIVLKLLQDREEINTPHGTVNISILLFQDICVVPMMIAVPLLAIRQEINIATTITNVLIATLTVIAVFLLARFLTPRFLNIIVRTRIKEIFVISSLLLCIGMSYVSFLLGLSLSLGAFISGIVISESRYSHQIVSSILPFKETFNSIFFISVGMLLDLRYVIENYLSVLSVSGGIVILKALIITGIVLLLKYPLRTAIISGIGLAQIGEFSFILSKLGHSYGLLSQDNYQLLLAGTILTMSFTPFAFNLSPRAAKRIEKGKLFLPFLKRKTIAEEQMEGIKDHVIIVGYGIGGKNLSKVLSETRIDYVIIELNPDIAKEAFEKKEAFLYGDASSGEILKAAKIEKAKTIVFVISDPYAINYAVSNARTLNKDIYIIVRTKHLSNIDELYNLGADAVYAEEFEASIEIVTKVMRLYNLPMNIVNKQINFLHNQRYRFLREEKTNNQTTSDEITKIITGGIIETFSVTNETGVLNKTIGDIDVRNKTGATVITIVRNEAHFPNPGADFKIKEGDTLVLTGTSESITKAIELLEKKKND